MKLLAKSLFQKVPMNEIQPIFEDCRKRSLFGNLLVKISSISCQEQLGYLQISNWIGQTSNTVVPSKLNFRALNGLGKVTNLHKFEKSLVDDILETLLLLISYSKQTQSEFSFSILETHSYEYCHQVKAASQNTCCYESLQLTVLPTTT